MTKHEAARLVASRNPDDYDDHKAGICMGIECQDCFRCPGDGRGNTSASVKAVAEAWLLANPEPVEEKKEAEE